MRACPSCHAVYSTDAEFCGLDGERLAEAPPDPLAGKIVGRYRLEELIGTGASGLVYRATTLDEGNVVAMKLLYGEMACDRRVVARFRREADTSSKMRHPNIVTVLDFEVAPSGLAYLVMELIAGISLDVAIEKDAPFLPERAARIAQQISAGLAEAHRQGFVHRDLKPGNVMITIQGMTEHVKILDFGIVGTMRSERGESRLTKTGYVVGTPAYMAPEQIDESVELGPPADVYALGAILYEMLAGYPPFGGTVEQILVKKLTREPDPLIDHGEIGHLAMALLKRDPRDRPPTALHVSAEIHRLSLIEEDPKTVLAEAPWVSPASDVINAPTVPFSAASMRRPSDHRGSQATLIATSAELALAANTPMESLNVPPVPPMIGAEPTLDGIGGSFAVTIAEHNEPATKRSTVEDDPLPILPAFADVNPNNEPSFTLVSALPTDATRRSQNQQQQQQLQQQQDRTDPGLDDEPSPIALAANALRQPAATPVSSNSVSSLEVTELAIAAAPSAASSDDIVRELQALGEAFSQVARKPSDPNLETLRDAVGSRSGPADQQTIFDATAIANLRDEAKLGSSPVPSVDPLDTTHGAVTHPGDTGGPTWTHSRMTYVVVGAAGFAIGLIAVFTVLGSRDDSELFALPSPARAAPPSPAKEIRRVETATQAAPVKSVDPPAPVPAPPAPPPTIAPVPAEELEELDLKSPAKGTKRVKKKPRSGKPR